MANVRRVFQPARLGAALCLTAVLGSGCIPLDDFMVSLAGRSMRNQRSLDPYENELQNQLLPPEGAVAFSSGNMSATHLGVNLGRSEGSPDVPAPFSQLDMAQNLEMVDAILNPVPPSPESLARGEEMFNRVCATCHGSDGLGSSAPIAEVFPITAAYPLAGPTAEVARGRSDGYLYGMIRIGRGLMPAYAHQVAHYDRWHIVNYLRQMQGVLPQGEAN